MSFHGDEGLPPIPREVLREHAGWRFELVWQIVDSHWTYRLSRSGHAPRYLKCMPTGGYPTVEGEVARTRWLAPYVTVPVVLGHGEDGDRGWLLTAGCPGLDGTQVEYGDDPRDLIRALARGLRRFHDAVPVADCPFDFRLDRALEHVARRVRDGVAEHADFHEEFAHLTVESGLSRLLDTRPASEDLVVCHGDYCAPNALVDEGEVSAFIDLGEVGVADRWWDVAVGTWSVGWNYGPGLEDVFLDAYGIERDEEQMAYYRLLYDLSS
ncbi:MAG: APH(3') family aminoglycoside O-phosphotransferase [Gemmatimonadota bacterium]